MIIILKIRKHKIIIDLASKQGSNSQHSLRIIKYENLKFVKIRISIAYSMIILISLISLQLI